MLIEGSGKFEKVVESDITLAALNATDIGRMETASACEFFLRPAFGVAEGPDSLA